MCRPRGQGKPAVGPAGWVEVGAVGPGVKVPAAHGGYWVTNSDFAEQIAAADRGRITPLQSRSLCSGPGC